MIREHAYCDHCGKDCGDIFIRIEQHALKSNSFIPWTGIDLCEKCYGEKIVEELNIKLPEKDKYYTHNVRTIEFGGMLEGHDYAWKELNNEM